MLFCLLLAVRVCVLIAFCHFVQLSELLVDLLLVVVQVHRFCGTFRQSGFASDFFSSLALLAVFLSLYSFFSSIASSSTTLSLLAISNTTTQHCATS